MKKLLLMSIIAAGLSSCDDKDDICYKKAWVTYDNEVTPAQIYERFPYNCDTGDPREDIAKKTDPHVVFQQWYKDGDINNQ